MAVNSRHRMIGVFTAELDDAYQAEIWRGIERRADELGLGVICFLGSHVASPIIAEAAANVAYGIADHRNVDGLILVSSAIMTFLPHESLPNLFNPARKIPQVSVGLKLDGIPGITVDGTEGIEEVIRHLALVHHRKIIAMIGGPPEHTEAAERRQTFIKTVKAVGLPVYEDLLLTGFFVQESGADAVRELVSRKIPFDALVCMNDRMAIGAIHELRKAGIRVPEDVSVTGFDGIEESASVMPSLTTIVQPLTDLGSEAVDVVHELMIGSKPSDRVLLCKPIFRESCGCPPGRHYRFNLTSLPDSVNDEEHKFIGELIVNLKSADSDAFISTMNRALLATAFEGRNLTRWNEYLSFIRHSVMPSEGSDSRVPDALLDFARVLVGETESRLQAWYRLATERKFQALRFIRSQLSGAFEIPVLLERLAEGLSLFGFRGGFLVLFDQNASAESGKVPATARLLMATGTGSAFSPHCGGSFRTSSILPPGICDSWKQQRWVFAPLVFRNEPLGYMLFSSEPDEPAVYDSLREEVSTALKGALLFEQMRTHEHLLEVLVSRRTSELTKANHELRKEIDRRTRLEQEVIEISNQTMERIGQDLHDDLCQHLAGISMFVSVVRNKLEPASRDAGKALDRIGDMLSDSIVRVKQIARGLVPVELEAWGFSSAVESLVEAARRRYQAKISFSSTEDFHIADQERALQMFRIIQEALTNALKHSGSDTIEVRLYTEDETKDGAQSTIFVAEVTDHGSGVQHARNHTGMGLRIMKYRAEKAEARFRLENMNPGTRVSCRIRCREEASN